MNNKPTSRKLSLKRESLRNLTATAEPLTDAELAQVLGGGGFGGIGGTAAPRPRPRA